MSEKFPMDQALQAADAGAKAATAGVLLKAAREAQGLHIGALAVTLKVPVRKLEALEADRHETLGDLVFTRALAGSVCRVLKIDPAPVMAALPQSEHPTFKTDESGLNTPFKPVGFVSGYQLKNRLTKPMSLAIALLLAGALAVFLWPENKSADVLPLQAPEAPEADVLRVVPSADPAAVPASDLPAVLLPTSPADATLAREVVGSPETATNGVPAILMLHSRGSSWVEITDAQGVVHLRKILAPGEDVRLQGPLPLSVVLGRADDVAVHVRGQRLDVSAMAKANVARFKVN